MGFSFKQPVVVSGGPVEDYFSGTTTNSYVEKVFGNGMDFIELTNESTTDSVQWSFNGATLEGNLLPGETMGINVSSKRHVYIKGTAGGGTYRIWAW
jgi:hypothetical protein